MLSVLINLPPENTYLVKKEGVKLLVINFKRIERLVERICNSEAKRHMFNFLKTVVPNFDMMSAVSKEKISRVFEHVTLLPGQ